MAAYALIHSGKVRTIGSSMLPASDLVEAHWIAERRGLERFHTEQPPYSLLNRGIEREVLPTAQRHRMGVLVWGPLGQGMLTGRVRKGQQTDDEIVPPGHRHRHARPGLRPPGHRAPGAAPPVR